VKIKKSILIRSEQGLHARPAALFVQIATKYDSSITVKKDALEIDGKSIMGILMLAAEKGTTIELNIEGEDAKELLEDLEQLLRGRDG